MQARFAKISHSFSHANTELPTSSACHAMPRHATPGRNNLSPTGVTAPPRNRGRNRATNIFHLHDDGGWRSKLPIGVLPSTSSRKPSRIPTSNLIAEFLFRKVHDRFSIAFQRLSKFYISLNFPRIPRWARAVKDHRGSCPKRGKPRSVLLNSITDTIQLRKRNDIERKLKNIWMGKGEMQLPAALL